MKIRILFFLFLVVLITLGLGYYFFPQSSNKNNIKSAQFAKAGILFKYDSKMPCKYKKYDTDEDHWYVYGDDIMIKIIHSQEKGVPFEVLGIVASSLLERHEGNELVKTSEISFVYKGKSIKGYKAQFTDGVTQEVYGCSTMQGTTMIILQDRRDDPEKPTVEFLAMKRLFIATLKLANGSELLS